MSYLAFLIFHPSLPTFFAPNKKARISAGFFVDSGHFQMSTELHTTRYVGKCHHQMMFNEALMWVIQKGLANSLMDL
ncbi:hypothetical protein SPWS13_4521 [Shewanella putrefaciens]|jgi:hypothetical protein|nr:hypothetical protein SPWS13_4521 [Shewanella putrefaciens]